MLVHSVTAQQVYNSAIFKRNHNRIVDILIIKGEVTWRNKTDIWIIALVTLGVSLCYAAMGSAGGR